MGDSTLTIIAIFLVAVLMFIFPLISVAERSDDISQLSVQSTTMEFVDHIRTTGKISLEDYDKYVQSISVGHNFDVEMVLQTLDENPGVKTTQAEMTKIGENLYYNTFTSQIEDSLKNMPNETLTLKEGDIFSVTVKNTDLTIAQSLKSFVYRIAGQKGYTIAAQHGGVVLANGASR